MIYAIKLLCLCYLDVFHASEAFNTKKVVFMCLYSHEHLLKPRTQKKTQPK